MMGTKALALDPWAAKQVRACVRFDYSGHGESGGAFVEGTVGRWLEESIAVFEQFCRGPQVVIGSSMGGWMALLLAREIARRGVSGASLAGLVLIAPAPDFTEALMWNGFSPEIRREIETRGVDGGGSQPSVARQCHRCGVPGSHPAGRAGSGRAVAARVCAGPSAAER